MIKRCVIHYSPSTPRAFSISGWISSIPGALPLWRYLTTSVTPSREIDVDTFSASNSALMVKGGFVRFRSSSECPFHCQITPSVEVSSVPLFPCCRQLGWSPVSPSWGAGWFFRNTLLLTESPRQDKRGEKLKPLVFVHEWSTAE